MSSSPFLDYAGLAKLLDINESWLRRHIKRLPHEKYGRAVRFSSEHVAEIRQLHAVQPDALPTSAKAGPAALVPLGARHAA
ncbi:DNA-binding protein [Kitasatospora sp. NPDC058444]|uniref:DNA-binding protein n=1 Tax=Kitasatospora sp. NPDC058444 TaxID=3346504 RepID=UPI00365FC72B